MFFNYLFLVLVIVLALMVLNFIISIPFSIARNRKDIKEYRAYRQFIEDVSTYPYPLYDDMAYEYLKIVKEFKIK